MAGYVDLHVSHDSALVSRSPLLLTDLSTSIEIDNSRLQTLLDGCRRYGITLTQFVVACALKRMRCIPTHNESQKYVIIVAVDERRRLRVGGGEVGMFSSVMKIEVASSECALSVWALGKQIKAQMQCADTLRVARCINAIGSMTLSLVKSLGLNEVSLVISNLMQCDILDCVAMFWGNLCCSKYERRNHLINMHTLLSSGLQMVTTLPPDLLDWTGAIASQ